MSQIVSRDAENIRLSAIKFEVNHCYFAIVAEVARLHWPMVEDEVVNSILVYK